MALLFKILVPVLYFKNCLYIQIYTTDQNVARGCEIIELCAKVQGQLFKILSQAAADGKYTKLWSLSPKSANRSYELNGA
jgi:hypothetical protein